MKKHSEKGIFIMQNKENDILQNKNGSWCYPSWEIDPVTHVIKKVSLEDAETLEEAKEKARNNRNRFQTELMSLKQESCCPYTFMEYLEHWYRKIYLPGSTSNSTRMKYYWIIYNIILPQSLPDCLFDKIDKKYLDNIEESCDAYCESAGYFVYKILKKILFSAREEGYLNHHIESLKRYPEPIRKIQLYNRKQLKTFLHAVKNDPYAHFLEYYLALFCGLRPGEILGLKYEDYDAAARILYINKQYTKDDLLPGEKRSANEDTYSFKPLRNEEERIFRVSDYITRALEERIIQNNQYFQSHPTKEDPECFCLSVRGKIKVLPTLNIRLKKIAEAKGLPAISMFDLRYMYTYMLIGKDLTPYEIASYLGQTKLSYTLGLCCQILEATSAEEGEDDEKTE